ncbi:SpoIIIAH-like family protein [Ornithinibacillus halophilus]|uniref:Stage III sporulation protein AH n=1 Tax=Ornithinibacillus halophilus TaxID=930117 RepID=A0A1M5CYJ3_9BACI|nr:SpoIIIAH-like family protein [Ornithinibacillus halophilus]SHF59780.1 stage III sporulation protein AH [Ornithinibacillus halophilus]
MLKKQTVWLLTMLSLMIVLSVYYMTQEPQDVAYINSGEEANDSDTEHVSSNTTDTDVDGDASVDDVSNLGRDELFTTIRMDLQDERSAKKSRLEEIIESSSATAEEKKNALSEIDVIEQIETKETILEESILASNEYQDVLVRNDGEVVHVHVKVDELSRTETVNIMQMVYDEFGEVTVDVNFQPTTTES